MVSGALEKEQAIPDSNGRISNHTFGVKQTDFLIAFA